MTNNAIMYVCLQNNSKIFSTIFQNEKNDNLQNFFFINGKISKFGEVFLRNSVYFHAKSETIVTYLRVFASAY